MQNAIEYCRQFLCHQPRTVLSHRLFFKMKKRHQKEEEQEEEQEEEKEKEKEEEEKEEGKEEEKEKGEDPNTPARMTFIVLLHYIFHS